MSKLQILILVALVSAIAFVLYDHHSESPVVLPEVRSWVVPEEKKVEPVIPKVEVIISDWPVVRTVRPDGLGRILADIDSHMPAGHQYRDNDKMTWAHETTHGINANVRNAYYMKHNVRVNAFYVLGSKAVIVVEPHTTMRRVVQNVPRSWRGNVWNLYMVRQVGDWNDMPLYICDEWSAYTNGTMCGRELGITGTRYDGSLEFGCEFIGYVLTLAYTIKQDCPEYDDKQFRAWVMYNSERLMNLYQGEPGAADRVGALRNSPDGEGIRAFARDYFGKEWCKKVLGF